MTFCVKSKTNVVLAVTTNIPFRKKNLNLVLYENCPKIHSRENCSKGHFRNELVKGTFTSTNWTLDVVPEITEVTCNTACLPGTFNIPGSTECEPCPEGTFSDEKGAYSKCKNCLQEFGAGYYSIAETGSTECKFGRSCVCQNGYGTKNAMCPKEGEIGCSSCKDGFYLSRNATSCVVGICECDHAQWDKKDRESRENISHAFWPKQALKVLNVRSDFRPKRPLFGPLCHGQFIDDLSCPEHQRQECISCDDSYHLEFRNEGKLCVENECYCEFGESVDDHENCPGHGFRGVIELSRQNSDFQPVPNPKTAKKCHT